MFLWRNADLTKYCCFVWNLTLEDNKHTLTRVIVSKSIDYILGTPNLRKKSPEEGRTDRQIPYRDSTHQ